MVSLCFIMNSPTWPPRQKKILNIHQKKICDTAKIISLLAFLNVQKGFFGSFEWGECGYMFVRVFESGEHHNLRLQGFTSGCHFLGHATHGDGWALYFAVATTAGQILSSYLVRAPEHFWSEEWILELSIWKQFSWKCLLRAAMICMCIFTYLNHFEN